MSGLNSQQVAWQGLYDKYLSALKFTVPDFYDVEGGYVIPVAQGLTCDMVCKEFSFEICVYVRGGIDAFLRPDSEVRSPAKGSYLVGVTTGIKPDTQYSEESIFQVNPQGKIRLTLLERMLLELFYYDEAGVHLSNKELNFCSGSRYLDFGVPILELDEFDGFRLYWDNPDDEFDG